MVGAIAAIIRSEHTPKDGERLPFGSTTDPALWLDAKHGIADKDGFFTLLGGKRAAVVHQYDRFGRRFRNTFLRFLEKLWKTDRKN